MGIKLTSSLLFALMANADSFLVGVSYGLNDIKITLAANLVIAFFTSFGTVAAMTAGKLFSKSLPKNISALAGGFILVAIGVWSLVKPLFKDKIRHGLLENPEKADKNNSKQIDPKEALLLSAALAANNIGLGLGASVTGAAIWLTACLTLVFGFLCLWLGCKAGKRCVSGRFSRFAPAVAGGIIVCMGVYSMIS